jgi:SAM-dependent methyltransferase
MDLTRLADAYWSAKDDRVDRERLRLLVDRIPARSAVLIVDGGPGMLAEMVRERGFEVRMTDVSAVAVERARAKGIDAQPLDTDDAPLPFADAAFDCVISDSAIEHRYFPEKALAECARVLKPEGTFLLLLPNIAHWRHRLWLLRGRFPEIKDGPSDRCHLRHFALPDLRPPLRDLGFRVDSVLGFPSLWVKGLYPPFFRLAGFRHFYAFLTRLRPTLFGRDLLLVCRKHLDQERPSPKVRQRSGSPEYPTWGA